MVLHGADGIRRSGRTGRAHAPLDDLAPKVKDAGRARPDDCSSAACGIWLQLGSSQTLFEVGPEGAWQDNA